LRATVLLAMLSPFRGVALFSIRRLLCHAIPKGVLMREKGKSKR
jgi:hypothetical protein